MSKLQQMQDLKFKPFLNKYSLFIFFMLIGTLVLGQTKKIKQIKKELDLVTDIESAKDFIKNNPELKTKIYTYNEEKHTNNLSKKLFNKSAGQLVDNEEQSATTVYKIIDITPTLHYRASYIYLDGKRLKKTEIDSLRSVIMTKLEQGKKFSYLAGNYSMDRNSYKGGDLGWFTEDKMFDEFVESLKTYKINTIYDLDVPDKKRYYTINKTYDEKNIRLLRVLKISFEKEKGKKLIGLF